MTHTISAQMFRVLSCIYYLISGCSCSTKCLRCLSTARTGAQVIPWIAHLKNAGQHIVRGIWALHQLEKDETPAVGDHTIDWLHGVGASKHIRQQLRKPHFDRGRRPFRFDAQEPQSIVQHQDVDLALNG